MTLTSGKTCGQVPSSPKKLWCPKLLIVIFMCIIFSCLVVTGILYGHMDERPMLYPCYDLKNKTACDTQAFTILGDPCYYCEWASNLSLCQTNGKTLGVPLRCTEIKGLWKIPTISMGVTAVILLIWLSVAVSVVQEKIQSPDQFSLDSGQISTSYSSSGYSSQSSSKSDSDAEAVGSSVPKLPKKKPAFPKKSFKKPKKSKQPKKSSESEGTDDEERRIIRAMAKGSSQSFSD